MAWIKEVQSDQDDLLLQIFSDTIKRTGKEPANVLKVHSIYPEILKIHMELYERLMFKESELSRIDREMIGVVVSKANSCPYCVSHHQEALNNESEQDENMKKIALNYRDANLSERQIAICEYSEKLTRTPYKMVNNDVIKLFNLGLTDRMVFEVNQIVAYFNYVNRIVFGLGVNLE